MAGMAGDHVAPLGSWDAIIVRVRMDVGLVGLGLAFGVRAGAEEAAGAAMAPHVLMEPHVSLVVATRVGTWVAYTPWLPELRADPPALINGEHRAPDRPSHGLRLRHDGETWRIT